MSPQTLRPLFWTVSFGGAGHLLSYHLGVARVILERKQTIGAVSGSSSGAIAAAVMTLFPHRLEEFTETFLRKRGRALSEFKAMLHEELRPAGTATTGTTINNTENNLEQRPLLVVAATKCNDGSMKLFTFDPTTDLLNDTPQKILLAIQASCTIPRSFHPIDIFQKSSALNYPDEEGIEIDGEYFVDGGIAAPSPPTPLDSKAISRIIVSPISDSSAGVAGDEDGGTKMSKKAGNDHNVVMIRPSDDTFTLPGGSWAARCGTFRIRPSIQNLRSMIHSLGLAPPGVLEDWHRRGVQDAENFLDSSHVKQFHQ